MNRPVIGIPIGDPSGIGPEIALKALRNSDIYKIARPLLIGDAGVLKRIETIIGTGLQLNIIDEPENGKYNYGFVDLISLDNVDTADLRFGEVQARAGRAAFGYIKTVTEMACLCKINAIATTPINKGAIKAAGLDFIGHTEMLAALTGTDDPLTMFQVHNLRVFFLSRHISLRKACDMIKKDRLASYITRCDDALRKLGLDKRRIAIAGLNPHNGEHGLFGDDELTEIKPAIEISRAKGIDAVGPVPADSVFYQALNGKFDAVLSLYHDQGHIATKTLDFERTISLTIGLPFLRTSVDHGTAFDIAGKGIASSVSMEEAIRLAAEYGPGYIDELNP